MSVKKYIPAGITRAPNRRYETALVWHYLDEGRSTTWITNRTFIPLPIILGVESLRARGKGVRPRMPPGVLEQMVREPYRRGVVDARDERRADAVSRRGAA